MVVLWIQLHFDCALLYAFLKVIFLQQTTVLFNLRPFVKECKVIFRHSKKKKKIQQQYT